MTTMSRTKNTRNPTKRNPGIGTSSMIIYVTNKKNSESFMAIIQEISTPTKPAVMAIPWSTPHALNQNGGFLLSGPRVCAQGGQQCRVSGHWVGHHVMVTGHHRDLDLDRSGLLAPSQATGAKCFPFLGHLLLSCPYKFPSPPPHSVGKQPNQGRWKYW